MKGCMIGYRCFGDENTGWEAGVRCWALVDGYGVLCLLEQDGNLGFSYQ